MPSYSPHNPQQIETTDQPTTFCILLQSQKIVHSLAAMLHSLKNGKVYLTQSILCEYKIEPVHEISNNVVWAIS